MSEKERIIERVRKLMRLANDSAATEGERDNALRMAHNTLAKYNLTMSEAEASGKAPEEERIEGKVAGRNDPWSRRVAYAIAHLFFCEYFYVSLPSTRVLHYFVGRASNVLTAQELSMFVIASINEEARRYAKETWTGSNGWRSFCKGATQRVAVRCYEIRKAAEAPQPAASPTGTALVLASVYASELAANTALIEARYGKLKAGVSREHSADFYAAQAGAEYGNKINLNRSIGSSKRKELT